MAFLIPLFAALLTFSHSSISQASEVSKYEAENVTLFANRLVLEAVKFEKLSPPLATRLLAIVHGGILEIDSRELSNPNESLAERAAALAFTSRVLQSEAPKAWPTLRGDVHAQIRRLLDRTSGTKAIKAALKEGHALAGKHLLRRSGDLLIAKMSDDGVGVKEGTWVASANQKALHPQWGHAQGFLLARAERIQLPPPPALGSSEYAEGVKEVLSLGSKESLERSEWATRTAHFWAQNGGTVTPPGQWNLIATNAAIAARLSPKETARLFAVLNWTLAEVAIICWQNKYEYRFLRPIQTDEAVRAGWIPLLATPPHPEYPSGHSSFSSAAALVLKTMIKDDRIFPLSVTSSDLPGEVRQYKSFDEAAQEAGRSRIYGGIHFQWSNKAGKVLGKDVAKKILAKTHSH